MPKEKSEKTSGKGVGILIVILIITTFISTMALLIKCDVGGFGSEVLRPVFKDVPVIKHILPPPSDEEVAALVSGQKLVVYYDFNQNGGDVNDRTGNGNHGVRTGFGPDGDAWGLSKGVFSLYLGAKVANETITSVDEALQDGGQTAHLKGVYSVSGQYVGKTIVGLPAGVYIVDGKKVVVK